MNTNKQYQFRAITSKQQLLICLVLWIFLYILFNTRVSNIFTFIYIITFFIISNFFISSVINFHLGDKQISIQMKNEILNIPLSEMSKVEFGTSIMFNNFTYIHLFIKSKNIIILTGFLFTSKKNTRRLKDFYFNLFREYMFLNFFKNEDIAKINKNNNFAERFTPIVKNK